MKKVIGIIVVFILYLGIVGTLYAIPYIRGSDNLDSSTTIDQNLAGELVKYNVKIDSKYYTNGTIVSEESGSGVIYYQSGEEFRILTNFHVISEGMVDTAVYTITTYDGIDRFGTYVFGNQSMDLAILRFSSDKSYPHITMSAKDIQEGTSVLAIGCPSGELNVVSNGKIGGLVDMAGYDYKVIQHSAMLSEGSSGGALFSSDGSFLGINTWMSSTGYYAIPVNIILNFFGVQPLEI